MRTIQLVDETFRDGPQSLWASRISTTMMLPIAGKMDNMGLDQIALGGAGAIADVAVRTLKENPWDRLRLMRQRIKKTPLVYSLREKNDMSFRLIPRDIQELWIERFIANGIDRVRSRDPEHIRIAKKFGVPYTIGIVAFTTSPVHTDEFFQKVAKRMTAVGVDHIMLKDPGGLLTPDRIRTLLPALKQVIGKTPVEIHTHCMVGLGALVCHEAVKLGAEKISTSIWPLANGAAQPAMQTMVRNLRQMGYQVETDDKLMNEVSDFLLRVAKQEGKPIGAPGEYDAFHYESQVPGGMISNFKSQLADVGMSDKLPDILRECARVRAELGHPIMITPFSQFVGTQAMFNVIQGERYKVVPDEVKKYALGYYGELAAPVEPNVLDKIIANGSQEIALTPIPPDPAVPMLRKRYPNMSDEERLLRFSFPGSQVDDMLAAGEPKTEYEFKPPVTRLIEELAKRPRMARVSVQKGDFKLELTGRAAPVVGAG